MLANGAADLRADVLKVGHHGSSTSSYAGVSRRGRTSDRPDLGGRRATRMGTRASDVVRALVASGAQVLRTDQLGSVVIRTDGRSLTIDAGGERWDR